MHVNTRKNEHKCGSQCTEIVDDHGDVGNEERDEKRDEEPYGDDEATARRLVSIHFVRIQVERLDPQALNCRSKHINQRTICKTLIDDVSFLFCCCCFVTSRRTS